MSLLIDVNAFVGQYPFRHIPQPDAGALRAVMEREGISHALVGYLPAPWHRAQAGANAELLRQLREHHPRLLAVPSIDPGWPEWTRELRAATDAGAAAVRVYPSQWSHSDSAECLQQLARRCAEDEITIILTTRFEDIRQRHWMDSVPDLGAPTVRLLARAHPGARVIVTAAGRALIEEIHWSLTPSERGRVWYDISWIWGPPANDLAHLLNTIGTHRFLFGSMWPLRLLQAPLANLALLPDTLRGAALCDARDAIPRLHSLSSEPG